MKNIGKVCSGTINIKQQLGMPNIDIETMDMDTQLRQKEGETVDINYGKSTKYLRKKMKRELRKKAALENLSMINEERCGDTPHRLDMNTLQCNNINDDVNNEEDSLCECGEQEIVVITDSVKRVIDSWENTEGMSKDCLRQFRFNESDRQTKARNKMHDMQRRRQRDSKNMRVRFYERSG